MQGVHKALINIKPTSIIIIMKSIRRIITSAMLAVVALTFCSCAGTRVGDYVQNAPACHKNNKIPPLSGSLTYGSSWSETHSPGCHPGQRGAARIANVNSYYEVHKARGSQVFNEVATGIGALAAPAATAYAGNRIGAGLARSGDTINVSARANARAGATATGGNTTVCVPGAPSGPNLPGIP